MRPYILADSNWKGIKDQSIELAVLPWGAVEAHNYHLPYSSDIIDLSTPLKRYCPICMASSLWCLSHNPMA